YLEIGPHPVLSSALRDATAEPEGSGMEPASQSPAAGEAPEDLASRGGSASGEDLASRGDSASGEDLASRGGAASRGNLPSRNTSAFREVQASLEAPASSEEADFPEEREPLLLSSLRRGEEDASVLLEGLGELYAAGLEPLWSSFYPAGPVLSLPLYPWQRQRHWFELSGVNETDWSPLSPQGTAEERHPHLESGTVFAATGHWVWESVLNTARHPYLQDHCAKGIPLFPAAGYLDIAVAAGRSIQDQAKIELTGVRFREALLLPEGQSRRVQVLVSAPSYGQSSFEIVSRPADEPQAKWTTHADGTIEYRQTGSEHDAEAESAPELLQPDTVLERLNHRMLDVAEHYDRLRLAGGEYGPLFRGMEQLAGGDREALASIRLPRGAANAARHAVHPALLDSAFQAMGGTLQEEEGLYLPVGVDRFTLLESPDDGILWSYAVLEEQAGEEAAGTVRICAEDGRLVAVAEGLRVRRLALAAGSAADDCLYRLDWQPSPALAPSPRKQPVHWLLLADRPGIAELAARELLSRGDICHLAFPGEDYAEEGNNRYRINPADPAHYARLLEQVRWHSGSDLAGVVHLWGTEAEADFTDGEKRIAQEQFLLQSVLELVRCLNADSAALRLWIATRGGCDAGITVPNPLQASLWGMGATAALELPALSCVLLDLDPEEDLEGAGVWLAQELLAGGSENRIAYRNRQRLVSRLVRWQPEAFSPDSLAAADAGENDFYLKIAQRGSFDHLQLQEMPRREPGPVELAIRVRASGLNFTDVLNVLDLLPIPDRKDVPGWECSGIVEAVGPGVENFREGDEVVALAPWSLGSRVIASALLTVRKPGQMSFADAAGIPAAFLTAYYSLYHIGRLQPGDRVLIHSASGGVGLAALQLSQLAGAEIFATAGTPEKRDYLRSLGVEHVYPSRTLDFAREIRRDTRGEGIDVVLNSLAGEAIEKSLELLRLGGRFLEIGVSDIYNNHRLGLLPFQRSLTYASILLYYICDEQPELLGRMLEDLMELFRQGRLTPLPATPFPASRADEAFRYMTASRHIGKIIVEFGGAPVRLHPNPGKSPVRQDGSYLITGGNTGLGLLTADWLVQQGARFLVLTGRRPAGSETIQAMERWTEQGVRCLSVQADAADGERMQTLFDQMEAELPPLRGIVHAAAVLSDGLLANLDWSQFSDVLRPKTAAAWNLDRLSRDKDLDFFIMYSSAASALGSPGQANYAAANFYLDALASARRRRGLPALSIGWGPWAKVGGAARPDRGGRLSGQGILSLEPETGLAALQRLLASGPAHALALEADWPKAAESHPGPWPLLHDLLLTPGQSSHGGPASAGHLRSTLLAAPADEAASLLAAELRGTIARILRTAPERLHSSRPLVSLGMDSLMAIELKNWIEHHTGVSLPVSALLQGEGISQLAARIAAELPKGNGAVREEPALSEEAAEAELTGRSHPLTANQLSLWFMHQFSPESAAYHIPKAVRIPGPLEPESLIRALQGMIRRHPALRTTFVTERKEPVQRIASEAPLSFRAEDVSGWSEAEIENCLREETNRPFDLAAGPLMRACLFSRSPEDHIMLMVFHHIIMDGWSFWIFFKELFELYEAERIGLPLAMPSVSGPYVAYLQACASGREFTESIAYWTAKLEGADPVLRLATDRPRPPVQTFTGASCSEVLDPVLSIRVKALAEERGTTLYALLLGAWQTLLHQYTGQEDLVVGTAVAGRNQAYLAGLIGYFVNMLAIRGTFTPGMTYHDALDAAHVRVNEALQYQELPFSRLVQLLRLKRDPARAPLFQASFTWQQAQTDRTGMLDAFALNLPGLLMNSGSLTFESYPLQWQGAMWDLALMMSEVDERLGILMQYNSDLYDERTIRRMISDFSNLLNEMTVDSTRPIRRLSASTLKE
uniref:SDR family NAD(P)-dependent oxidoreductase n=1 Tax=Paenibacillus glufosinatiresistens TaxID=3070657 RepID=UPI00286E4D73